MSYPSIKWHKILNHRFIDIPNCWDSCNGGTCCDNSLLNLPFLALPRSGTNILYLEEEIAYFKAKNLPLPKSLHLYELDFSAETHPLRLYGATCTEKGFCDGILSKPLLCKLYPLLPIIDATGELESIYYGNPFLDTVHSRVNGCGPCPLVNDQQSKLASFITKENIQLLNHPKLILYLQAAKHFTDLFNLAIQSSERLKHTQGRRFLLNAEFDYLTGKIIDVEELKQRVRDTYEELTSHYGNFRED